MEIKGIDILNSNDYDSLYIDNDMVIVGRIKKRDNSNFTQVGTGLIDDEFLQLTDDEQVKKLVENYLLYSSINGVFRSNLEFSALANRKLVFGDRSHQELEKAVLDKYHIQRKQFLLESISEFSEFNFYERIGYSYYSNMGAIDCDTPEFILASIYDELGDIDFIEEEKEFFFEAVDMIAGDNEVVLNIENFVDEEGEFRVKSSTISDGIHTINLHYLLTDLAKEAASKHNQKVNEGKKLQIKMEGF